MFPSQNLPPTEEEIDELAAFLDRRAGEFDEESGEDPGIVSISQLDGFLTAIVSGPELILPSVWMRTLWGDRAPEFESEEEAAMFFGTIFRMMNDNAEVLMEHPKDFECLFVELEDEPGEDFVDLWCSGYMNGVSLWEELPTAGDEIDHLVFPIFVNSVHAPEEAVKELSEEDLRLTRRAIPACARMIHKYWLDRREEFMPGTPSKKRTTIGVNEPCPCGSGSKYKKCCGARGN